MPAKIQLIAKLTHLVLWALILFLPITTLVALGSEEHPLTLLGAIRLDKWPTVFGGGLAHLFDWGDAHKFLGDAIVCFAGLHSAAAIYYHPILKDGVLLSMTPEWRNNTDRMLLSFLATI